MKEGLSRSGVLLVGGGESGISKGGRGEIEGKEWPVVGVVMVEDTENVGDQAALKCCRKIALRDGELGRKVLPLYLSGTRQNKAYAEIGSRAYLRQYKMP